MMETMSALRRCGHAQVGLVSMDWILALYLTAQVVDTSTTLVGLQRGYQEVNPLIPQSPVGLLAVKAGATTVNVILYHQLKKKHPKAAKIAFGILAGVVGTAAVHNAYRLR